MPRSWTQPAQSLAPMRFGAASSGCAGARTRTGAVSSLMRSDVTTAGYGTYGLALPAPGGLGAETRLNASRLYCTTRWPPPSTQRISRPCAARRSSRVS